MRFVAVKRSRFIKKQETNGLLSSLEIRRRLNQITFISKQDKQVFISRREIYV